MYKFTELDQQNTEYLPSSALIIDGVCLDESLQNFRTLTVDGVGVVTKTHEVIEKQNGGEILISSHLNAKTIIVKWLAKTSDYDDYKKLIAQLNAIFSSKDYFKISTKEDEAFYYECRLIATQAFEPHLNAGISEMTFFCPNGFALAKNTQSDTAYDGFLPLGFEIEQIKVTLSSVTTGLQIVNQSTGRRIVLTGDIAAGNVTIKSDKVLNNNQNIMHQLDFMESDFHDFKIGKNDVITADKGTLELTLRARR